MLSYRELPNPDIQFCKTFTTPLIFLDFQTDEARDGSRSFQKKGIIVIIVGEGVGNQGEVGCQEHQGSQEGIDHLEPQGNQQVGSHQEGRGSLGVRQLGDSQQSSSRRAGQCCTYEPRVQQIQEGRLGNHQRAVAAHLLRHQE